MPRAAHTGVLRSAFTYRSPASPAWPSSHHARRASAVARCRRAVIAAATVAAIDAVAAVTAVAACVPAATTRPPATTAMVAMVSEVLPSTLPCHNCRRRRHCHHRRQHHCHHSLTPLIAPRLCLCRLCGCRRERHRLAAQQRLQHAVQRQQGGAAATARLAIGECAAVPGARIWRGGRGFDPAMPKR